jgi:hypothetical protein
MNCPSRRAEGAGGTGAMKTTQALRIMIKVAAVSNGNGQEQIEFERYEAKYVIPPSLVTPIREFIRPFTIPDRNASGDPLNIS